jgi:hypothetical protein
MSARHHDDKQAAWRTGHLHRPNNPDPTPRHEYNRPNRGKQQLRRGVVVPQVAPQARRAQNAMPVELLCPVSATLSHVSTEDQILSAELHGEVLLAAKRPELQPLIDHLREVAQGRDDIRVECAGTIAGWWFADTARKARNSSRRAC